MSYVALYRKWRPDEFEEVKGQEHVVTTLKNQIKHDRIGHAYLFCGTRGTGKTTIAKLLAKVVNCEHPVDGSPCNKCESCKAIAAGASTNVVEIDAASNNGVDNIRQINNAVQYSPASGRYLVYIIDEAHMLSAGAFNALLKTLEEPPSYVIFILATTEAHKIPITINSRCQRYDFKRITIETIADRLQELLERESIEADRDAILYVAKAADGSMRDALSILDQCIAFNLGERLTYERVLETIGAVDIDVYISLFEAVISEDARKAVDIVDQAVWDGRDLAAFVNEFMIFIRNVLMLKLDPDMHIDYTKENIDKLLELGREVREAALINYINILEEAAQKITKATTKRIALEIAVIKMSKTSMQEGVLSLEGRIESIEERLEKGDFNVPVQMKPEPVGAAVQGRQKEERSGGSGGISADETLANIKNYYGEATVAELNMIVSAWKILQKDSVGFLKNVLAITIPTPSAQPSTIELYIENIPDNDLKIEYLEKKENVAYIEEYLLDKTERHIHLVVIKKSRSEIRTMNLDTRSLNNLINGDIEYKF